MPGGRPTDDPKQTLVAERLAARQMRALEARAKRESFDQVFAAFGLKPKRRRRRRR